MFLPHSSAPALCDGAPCLWGLTQCSVCCSAPLAAPSAPRDLKVLEVTRQQVHLSWEAPEHDGGSPLTGYQVEKRDVSRKTWVKVRELRS